MSSADSVSLRLSNTPTTTQAVRCFSGLPLFMVNSIRSPGHFLSEMVEVWIIRKKLLKSQNFDAFPPRAVA
jgi:hypothetical protein